MNLLSRLTILGLTAASVGAITVTAQGQSVSYSARVVNFEEPLGRASGLIQVRITQWSTEADRNHLTDALLKTGQKGLIDALYSLPQVGVLRTPGTAGHTFRYARLIAAANGDADIEIILDRPLGFTEFRQGWQTVAYPFTIVRMHLNDQGEGDGQILAATKIAASAATQEIAFEHYSASPLLLQNVRLE